MKLLKLLILATALLSQEPDDPHEGQPATCNGKETQPCECNHAMQCPGKERGVEDSHCKVYCRHEACKCCKECPTT